MPGSYWCLPRELVRCRTLFRGTSRSPELFLWILNDWCRLVMRHEDLLFIFIWNTLKHSEISNCWSWCILFVVQVGEDSGNCQSQSRAPRMLRLRGNAVKETDTWCGNLWTSDSFRGPFSSPVQCSMVDECGAMKGTSAVRHTKQSIYVDLCMAWTRHNRWHGPRYSEPTWVNHQTLLRAIKQLGGDIRMMPLDSYFEDSWPMLTL